jgi:hypothetical protein
MDARCSRYGRTSRLLWVKEIVRDWTIDGSGSIVVFVFLGTQGLPKAHDFLLLSAAWEAPITSKLAGRGVGQRRLKATSA